MVEPPASGCSPDVTANASCAKIVILSVRMVGSRVLTPKLKVMTKSIVLFVRMNCCLLNDLRKLPLALLLMRLPNLRNSRKRKGKAGQEVGGD